ncbi:hypothetical protein Gogos_022184 [Gossypium gossypioides]|uniref:Uncharacterized protein n=1 Tax=Gossypium gossypioides TaxID=34282 RepID=A0A7J9D726_GOSGO|nr:hypothetical protein [Gossypium gossypioides]
MESSNALNEITYNTWKFLSLDAKGFFHKLHGQSIVYEYGFDPDAIFENELWDIEDKLYVRGREVETSPPVISKYYRVPFLANDEIELLETRYFKGVNVDSIMLYLTEDETNFYKYMDLQVHVTWCNMRRDGDFLSAFDHRSMSRCGSTYGSIRTVLPTDYAYDNIFNIS